MLLRSLAKQCPEFVRTSMLTFFNHAAEDVGTTVQHLQEVGSTLHAPSVRTGPVPEDPGSIPAIRPACPQPGLFWFTPALVPVPIPQTAVIVPIPMSYRSSIPCLPSSVS